MGCNTAQPVCRGWVRAGAGAVLYHDSPLHPPIPLLGGPGVKHFFPS